MYDELILCTSKMLIYVYNVALILVWHFVQNDIYLEFLVITRWRQFFYKLDRLLWLSCPTAPSVKATDLIFWYKIEPTEKGGLVNLNSQKDVDVFLKPGNLFPLLEPGDWLIINFLPT